MLNEKELKDISVSELCEKAGIDRSTFYDNYADTFALANPYAEKIEKSIAEQPHTNGEFTWIFDYIKSNADVFEMYFKLGMSKKINRLQKPVFQKRRVCCCKNVV